MPSARPTARQTTQSQVHMHAATRSPAADSVPERIVNVDRLGNQNLTITVSRDACFTFNNARTGTSERHCR